MTAPRARRDSIEERRCRPAHAGLALVRSPAATPGPEAQRDVPATQPLPRGRIGEGEIRQRATAIARHRRALGSRLGRDVGDSVATLDYLLNVSGDLVAPAAVEGEILDVLERGSSADPLTGLPNRSAFNEELGRAVAQSLRYGTPLSLLILDMDGFRIVNARWGRFAGDLVLSAVSGAIQESLRATDVAFRFGGDVFAVLLPSTPAGAARLVAERVVAQVRSCVAAGPVPALAKAVSASVGVAQLARQAPMPQGQLVAAAHLAMYVAKGRGGNCVGEAPKR